MSLMRLSLAALVCCATGLSAQQKPASDTIMVFWRGQNAQLPDSAKSVIRERLKAVHQNSSMRVLVLDTGSSKDSMVVATRLGGIRGFLTTNSVAMSRIRVGTRNSGWATDTVGTGPLTNTLIIASPAPATGTGTEK